MKTTAGAPTVKSIAPNLWWGLGIGAVGIALLALMASPNSRDASAAPDCPFTIDFAGLPHGTILGEQYASQGVHISGVGNNGGPDALIVFDTGAQQDHDPDLAIDIGNIAIFALNTTDLTGPPNNEGPPDGLVDDPDENNLGGTATFAFDQDVSIGTVQWIDKDHVVDNFIIAYDAAGTEIKRVSVPLGANASVQTIDISAEGVRRLVFDYDESGGFTGIEVDCEQETPTPTSAVETATPTAPAPTPTPTAAATATPTPAADTPTPTSTSTAATPTAAAATATPASPTETPTPTVAAAVSAPNVGTSVAAGPGALPAGGGPRAAAEDALSWAGALAALALVLGGSVYSMRRERR